MKKTIFTTAAAAILAAGPAAATEQVKIGQLSWDGALAIQHILKTVIEENFDAEVSFVPVETQVAYSAMDRGDGSLDVYPDLWMPNDAALWDKYIAEGSRETVIAGNEPYIGTQGFYIPGYIQDEYGITKVSDLADPEIAKLFDIDGDGKGDYWAGVAGWETTYINQVRAKSYGFDKYFEPLIVSDAAFKAELKARIARKEGVLFYYWTPEWLFAKYDLRQLEEPEFTGYAMENKKGDPNYNPDGCWKMYQPDERDDWLAASKIKCAWPDAKVYIGYSSAFAERAPEIAEFFNNVHFETDWVANWIAAIAVDQRLPEAVAETWIEEHQDVVQGWLPAES